MWRRTLRRVDARWLPGVFALLLIAGVWVVTVAQLRAAERDALDDAARDAGALVRLFGEHATRTLEAADQAVIFLRHRYRSEGRSLDIRRALREGLGPSDLYNLFSIVGPGGDVVLASAPFAPLNLSDREHVLVHQRDPDAELYISKPVLGRVSKKWSLQLTRRISGADGGYQGVVVASMDPAYFTRLYQDIDVGRQGSIALVGADGVMRARRLGLDERLGQDIHDSAVFAALRANGHGLLTAPGPIDGRVRIYAYAKLDRFPLYALVGFDRAERLAEHMAGRQRALALAAGVTLVIALFAGAIVLLVGWLSASRAEAIGANLAKSRFLSTMSHELRTPLNGILGYSELLAMELGASRAGGFVRAINGCGMKLLGLVEAVLELSALETGQAALELEAEPLGELLQQAAAGQRDAAHAKGLALDLRCGPGLPRRLVCDRRKLLRVLDILLRNAVDATDAGAVQLSADVDGPGVLLRVSDTGRGVPAALRRRIFEKFVQAEGGADRGKDGPGLGLAIAAQLVELMGGGIWVGAAAPRGAVFSVSLPCPRRRTAPVADTAREAA
ncbi:ATP-binding protein [Rugamonas sp.]|uniref:sensor histidine kinase n=1 Tax=Rugamonas sp. TaxID=1926287 RepID=UPI0025F2E41A|nr:ATP-binding protein [Rugamonas sp.]